MITMGTFSRGLGLLKEAELECRLQESWCGELTPWWLWETGLTWWLPLSEGEKENVAFQTFARGIGGDGTSGSDDDCCLKVKRRKRRNFILKARNNNYGDIFKGAGRLHECWCSDHHHGPLVPVWRWSQTPRCSLPWGIKGMMDNKISRLPLPPPSHTETKVN